MKTAPAEPARWLFKEEPEHYSFADLQRDGSTIWSGVSNPLALKNLRQTKVGDRVLYYHTGKERAVVGEMQITQGPGPDPTSKDPKAVVVTVEPSEAWHTPVTLDQIKNDKGLGAWELVRLPRLSIVPIHPKQFERLEQLRRQAETMPGDKQTRAVRRGARRVSPESR